MLKVRQPWVAGRWYPRDAKRLRSDLENYCAYAGPTRVVRAVVAPHAGFVFSGHTAGQVFARTSIPSKVIMLGPKHTRLGAPYAIMPSGLWDMPLGQVRVDESLARQIMEAIPDLRVSEAAHEQEHALEAHLPFLQHLSQAPVAIVPIVLTLLSFSDCVRFGTALARVIKAQDEAVLIAASTDMSHFISAKSAERLDRLAIQKIIERDPEGLYQTVFEKNISMCGVIPTTVTLVAANLLGADGCELVEYTHSGQVSGDHDSVVGYAGLTIY